MSSSSVLLLLYVSCRRVPVHLFLLCFLLLPLFQSCRCSVSCYRIPVHLFLLCLLLLLLLPSCCCYVSCYCVPVHLFLLCLLLLLLLPSCRCYVSFYRVPVHLFLLSLLLLLLPSCCCGHRRSLLLMSTFVTSYPLLFPSPLSCSTYPVQVSGCCTSSSVVPTTVSCFRRRFIVIHSSYLWTLVGYLCIYVYIENIY